MNPIINPWWFYLIDVLDKVEVIAVISIVIVGGILSFVAIVRHSDDAVMTNEEKKGIKKVLNRLLIAFIVSFIAAVTVPNKETMYAMMVAKQVTANNIQTVGGNVKDTVDYIFEKIKELDAEK